MYFRTASKYKSPEGLFIIIGTFLLLDLIIVIGEEGLLKPKGKYAGFCRWAGIKRRRIRAINTQVGLDVLLIGLKNEARVFSQLKSKEKETKINLEMLLIF